MLPSGTILGGGGEDELTLKSLPAARTEKGRGGQQGLSRSPAPQPWDTRHRVPSLLPPRQGTWGPLPRPVLAQCPVPHCGRLQCRAGGGALPLLPQEGLRSRPWSLCGHCSWCGPHAGPSHPRLSGDTKNQHVLSKCIRGQRPPSNGPASSGLPLRKWGLHNPPGGDRADVLVCSEPPALWFGSPGSTGDVPLVGDTQKLAGAPGPAQCPHTQHALQPEAPTPPPGPLKGFSASIL